MFLITEPTMSDMQFRRSYRRSIAVSCVAFGFFSGFLTAYGQPLGETKVPSETKLPGETKVPSETPLPDETQLPGKPATSPAADLPPESALPNKSATPQTPPELPAESVLPPRQTTEPNIADGNPRIAQLLGPAGTVDLLNLGASMDLRPWFALRSEAPVSMVRSVVFTPDSKRLCVAGDDKTVLVYRRFPRDGQPSTWGFERTIRWQVQRGPRGRIHAMDARNDRLAIGGLSAMGEAGDILLVDPTNGVFQTVLTDAKSGHNNRVTGLSFAPGKELTGLASMDVDGRLVFWSRNLETGQWTPRRLKVNDAAGLPSNLSAWRILHPIAMLTATRVVVPYFDGTAAQKRWRLAKINVESGELELLPAELSHQKMVTGLATNVQTEAIASADYEGNVFLITKAGAFKLRLLPAGHFGLSLSFSSDGSKLVVCSTVPSGTESVVQLFDVSNPQRVVRLASTKTPAISFADVSPDGTHVASGLASQVAVHDVGAKRITRFGINVPVPVRVAFSKVNNDYRIAIARGNDTTGTDQPGSAPYGDVFDTERLQLRRAGGVDSSGWSNPKQFQGRWRLATREVAGEVQFYLMFGSVEKAALPLDSQRAGTSVRSEFWIPGPDGRPAAVAIGTTGQNNIYVYALADEGVCPLIRQFRGHTAAVVALGMSPDQKYLVSGSLDRTVRVWRLDGNSPRSIQIDRWGAEFEPQGGEVVATRVREDGPLYLRGMRQGDVITRLRLPKRVDGEVKVEPVNDPVQILAALADNSTDAMVAFDYRRGVVEQRAFQTYPAWPCTVSLFIDKDDEWAYWTPSGYYDASFEGHRLFGWHVNRGAAVRPDFFLASQLRKALERPRVMSKLLRAGSVDEAFRQADARVPANSQWALRDQQRMAPRVHIEAPSADAELDDTSVELRATIVVPKGQQLVPPKAFANGVVAGQRRLVSQQEKASNMEFTYQWDAPLPSDRRIRLQVIAATETEVTGADEVLIRRQAIPPSVRSPRLFVAAAAVGVYRDTQIPQLDANVADALRVVRAFEAGSKKLYTSSSLALLDENVTRSGWNLNMKQLAESLRDRISPDDLLVILLSGHGLQDADTQEYYFLPSDVNFADVMTQRYEKCISGADLAMFSEIPCRKIVVLDTCHSGAVQPLRQSQLKSALRTLQDDLMLTMTASEGHQEAVQSRFARRLEEGLRGAADQRTGNRNGIVTLNELGQFVRTMVAADSAQDAVRQVPTVGPKRLVELVEFPLTSVPVNSAAK